MEKGQKLIYTEKKFSLWLAAAAVMHALVIFLAISLQSIDARRQAKPKIVSVSLVSLPGVAGSHEFSEKKAGGEAHPATSPEAPHPVVNKKSVDLKKALPEVAPVTPKKEKKPVKVKEVVPKAAKVTPKKIAIEPLPAKVKPKAIEKPADISKALERIKQNVDKKTAASPPQSAGNLNDALARLQQKVKAQGTPASSGSGSGQGGSTGARSGAGKGYGGGTSAPYKAEIASIIMQNWEFSKLLLKNSYGMEVYVRINISTNGTITKIIFDKRAPSEYLNNSVKRALEKSSPLPVLPKEEGAKDAWIGFVFTPEGIEK